MSYPSYRFDDAKFLESGKPVSYTDRNQLNLAVSLRILSMFLYAGLGHDFSTMILFARRPCNCSNKDEIVM